MNKQSKNPSLFDQALVIAINEGKIESSKDAAASPSQSGIVGENYLLFSKQRKLLISIPLEKLKRRNTRKVNNTNEVEGCFGCGCLPMSLIGIAYLAFSFAITWPKFSTENIRARTFAALNSIATIAKECAATTSDAETGTFIIPEIQGYRSNKKNIAGFYVGNNRKISGTRIVCPTTGEIKLVSENERTYPTFSYNVGTGKRTCIADSGSIAEKMSCKNGEW